MNQLISDNIARLMAVNEINAAALAEKSGLNRTAVYDIIAGRSQSPRVQTVASLAEALRVPISDMFLTPEQIASQDALYQTFLELPENVRKNLPQLHEVFRP